MKTFKNYLTEVAPAWTESLSTALFDLPRAGLKDVRIHYHHQYSKDYGLRQFVQQHFM